MQKIYIASRWQSQQRLREVCDRLVGVVEVTSGWIHVDRPEDPTAAFFKEYGLSRAEADVEDVRRADMLVLDLLDGRGRRGGMMFEAGLAHGLGKPVIVVGDADCVFTQLFPTYPDWPTLIGHLRGI